MSKTDYDFYRLEPPHDTYDCVRTVVKIRHNESGEEVEYDDYLIWDEDYQSPSYYIWEEGNYSCDDNRSHFFHDAKGVSRPEVTCSKGRYSVEIRNKKNGEVIYSDLMANDEWEGK